MRIVKVNNLDPSVWQQTPGNIYVGRRVTIRAGRFAGQQWYHSILANPWKVTTPEEVAQALDNFEQWLREAIADETPEIMQAMRGLTEESVLGCWCTNLNHNSHRDPSEARCHAEVVRRVWYSLFGNRKGA